MDRKQSLRSYLRIDGDDDIESFRIRHEKIKALQNSTQDQKQYKSAKENRMSKLSQTTRHTQMNHQSSNKALQIIKDLSMNNIQTPDVQQVQIKSTKKDQQFKHEYYKGIGKKTPTKFFQTIQQIKQPINSKLIPSNLSTDREQKYYLPDQKSVHEERSPISSSLMSNLSSIQTKQHRTFTQLKSISDITKFLKENQNLPKDSISCKLNHSHQIKKLTIQEANQVVNRIYEKSLISKTCILKQQEQKILKEINSVKSKPQISSYSKLLTKNRKNLVQEETQSHFEKRKLLADRTDPNIVSKLNLDVSRVSSSKTSTVFQKKGQTIQNTSQRFEQFTQSQYLWLQKKNEQLLCQRLEQQEKDESNNQGHVPTTFKKQRKRTHQKNLSSNQFQTQQSIMTLDDEPQLLQIMRNRSVVLDSDEECFTFIR